MKKALTELCDLLAEDSSVLSHGLSLLWSQCPSLESFSDAGFRPSVRQVNGILAAARYLSRSREPENLDGLLAVVLQFVAAIPNISRNEAWHALFTPEVLDGYFKELLEYLAEICVKWPDVASSVSNVLTEFVLNITGDKEDSSEWMRYPAVPSLLAALAANFPALDSADADSLTKCILRHWIVLPLTPIEASSSRSVSTQNLSAQSSPIRFFSSSPSSNGKSSSMMDLRTAQGYMSDGPTLSISADDSPSQHDANGFFTPSSTPGRGTPGREPGGNVFHMNGNGNGSRTSSSEYFENHEASKRPRQFLISLERESVLALERQEFGFRLIVQILEKIGTDEDLVSQLRTMALSQIAALLPLLKARVFLSLYFFFRFLLLLLSDLCREVLSHRAVTLPAQLSANIPSRSVLLFLCFKICKCTIFSNFSNERIWVFCA